MMNLDLEISAPAFDPSQQGTLESTWETVLRATPWLSLPSSAIVVVSPHPDDEVLGAGGLIRSAALAGRSVTILSVTDGEAAYPDWRDLGRIRRRELNAALSVLIAREVSIDHLGIADGHVAKSRETLFDAIDRRLGPDALLVSPYEYDGHPDHDVVGEVCGDIARLRGVTLWRYPIWLWHRGAPESFAGNQLSRFGFAANIQESKARALDCFTSQFRPLGREPIVPSHVLSYFKRPYEVFLT